MRYEFEGQILLVLTGLGVKIFFLNVRIFGKTVRVFIIT